MGATKRALASRDREKRALAIPPPQRPKVNRQRQQEEAHIEAIKDRKRILGMLLVPVCLFAILVLGELLFRATVRGALWKQEGLWFFAVGCLCWAAMAILRKIPLKPVDEKANALKPVPPQLGFWETLGPILLGFLRKQALIAYVYAHEMSHVLALWMSLGRSHGMSVSEKGGYVAASKTNWFITLAPYLLPFYTLIVFAVWGVTSLLFDLNDPLHVPFHFKPVWFFYYWIGLTWTFHIAFTFEVLHTEQSDLLHNGEFFSMILIFGGNIAVLAALFLFTGPLGITWHSVGNDATACLWTIWDSIAFLFKGMWHLLRNDQ